MGAGGKPSAQRLTKYPNPHQPVSMHSQLLQHPQPEEGAVLQHCDLVVAQQPVGMRAQGWGEREVLLYGL